MFTYLCCFVLFFTSAIVTSSFTFPNLETSSEVQQLEVQALIVRLIGSYRATSFSIEISGKFNHSTDSFTVVKLNNIIYIKASSGVAAAYGFHFYLKNFCNCHISWDNDQLSLPSLLPFVNITIKSPDQFRYYQNVCTYSYSYVWWNWERWEREIDWMALNGINLALAFTAQETIWSRVYRMMNLTEKDINEHFTGPAFLAWGRMANIRGWGGPLFKNWYEDQLDLQHKILRRMKNLGINPILPAFCGHVPRAFKRVFPNAKLTPLSSWNKFEANYCCPFIIEPNEPLFEKVAKLFYETLRSEFGKTHYYSCDIFNELKPPNSSLTYLKNISSKVSNVLLKSDATAIWIMQGWLFGSDMEFWTKERAYYFLSGIPNDRMIILDLQSELRPLYEIFDFYFGKPFIWCMLHNFGGTLGMHGSLDVLNINVIQARAMKNSTIVGTGMTPEGINQNYIVYDFMSEVGWRNTSVDVDLWVEKYSERRYGLINSNLKNAWRFLKRSVYNYKLIYPLHGQYTLIMRPTINHKPWIWYNISDVVSAWDLMIFTNVTLHKNENYRHDLIDVTRQMLQNLFDHFYMELIRSYWQKNLIMLRKNSRIILSLLKDLDSILSTNHRFMLGVWLEDAVRKGRNENERKILHENALFQITLWGPNGEVFDYACKQWSGMIQDYYHPRWKLFTKYLYDSLIDNTPFGEKLFKKDVFRSIELPFAKSAKNYTIEIRNDTYVIAKSLYLKWRSIFRSITSFV